MSESDQFRQYADETLLWVAQSKTEQGSSLYAHGPKQRSRATAYGSSRPLGS